ncbi:GtrA family protein [Sphingobacterium bambusae]|uniref:GtrA family protein n=1 Tax=Sphingobacterium bambusae TaxID=662858 RepID=UPI0036D439FF
MKYLFWGGFNVLLSWILYFVTYHYIISKNNVEILPFLTISGHIFSFLLSFVITFFTGFVFNNFLVFNSAKSEPIYKKLFRYFLANMGSLLINYVLLKIFVEYFMFYPTPSQILCTFIITIYSFLMQKKFTFRK